MGSRWGEAFSITTFGESHGGGVGVVVDGCPPRLALDVPAIQAELDRRRPGQSKLTTTRNEADVVEILSGVMDGLTLGTPIGMLVRNQDAKPQHYDRLTDVYRPSHADFTYDAKYGIRARSGGGRASARETIGRVAGGAVARQLLADRWGVEIIGAVEAIGQDVARIDLEALTRGAVELMADGVANPTRCPDPSVAERMYAAIDAARRDGDSLGGVVVCVARGVPAGWGEPVFDKLEADLAKAVLSIPAAKAFESGSGFAGTKLRGSAHNDAFYADDTGRIRTRTNRSGGIQGGISNGEDIVIRVGFKPTATIHREQETVTATGAATTLAATGRHDPCVVPRAVPIVEAMCALTLADHALRQCARQY